MNRQQFLEYHKQFCQEIFNICVLKNTDYSTEDNPFSNFEKAELLGLCKNETGIMLRMMDKISRIINFINKGELLVKDENVNDSLKDLANYCILLSAYIEQNQYYDDDIMF